MALALILLFSSGLKIPVLDKTADAYFQESILKAGVAYATCRVINASVSIVKESKLQLEPGGVGVSLAIGQALDPIDDMTERLSDILVTAIVSLAAQKLVYEMGISLAPPILGALLFLLSILIWISNERVGLIQKILAQSLLFILIARFCLPVSSVANEFVHAHFFEAQTSEARSALAVYADDFDTLKDFSFPKTDGVFGTIKNNAVFLKEKSTEFIQALGVALGNMGNIIENLLKLTFLYVGIFLIQVIILPLMAFWFLMKTAGVIFPKRITVATTHPAPRTMDETAGPQTAKA